MPGAKSHWNGTRRPDAEINGAIGLRVRICRESKGFSQAVIAKRLGVDQSRIAKIESGDAISALQVIKLALILNVSYPMLLGSKTDYE